ncbi:EcsC family protein [uncultured Propionibacterium sp.]|uniref:EcsC family protein n=1 Tax=uncultured Propionibacterium sp. TaxID=218066 RepID=UPI00292F0FB6|nr:EcsC family protein [uncultured Propionibacterium sp.]
MALIKKPSAADIGGALVSIVPIVASGPTAGALRHLADHAINGVARLPGAREAAATALGRQKGGTEAAIDAVSRAHTSMAGAQGFVTNLGGTITALAGIPANLAAVTVIQTRMVAAIAHLRGYDLDDPRVRQAVWITLLGRRTAEALVADGRLPSTPQGVATAPVSDDALEQQIAEQVLGALLGRAGTKQTVAFIGKRIPAVGGGVGLATDGYTTWTVARYARQQFVPRRSITPTR